MVAQGPELFPDSISLASQPAGQNQRYSSIYEVDCPTPACRIAKVDEGQHPLIKNYKDLSIISL